MSKPSMAHRFFRFMVGYLLLLGTGVLHLGIMLSMFFAGTVFFFLVIVIVFKFESGCGLECMVASGFLFSYVTLRHLELAYGFPDKIYRRILTLAHSAPSSFAVPYFGPLDVAKNKKIPYRFWVSETTSAVTRTYDEPRELIVRNVHHFRLCLFAGAVCILAAIILLVLPHRPGYFPVLALFACFTLMFQAARFWRTHIRISEQSLQFVDAWNPSMRGSVRLADIANVIWFVARTGAVIRIWTRDGERLDIQYEPFGPRALEKFRRVLYNRLSENGSFRGGSVAKRYDAGQRPVRQTFTWTEPISRHPSERR